MAAASEIPVIGSVFKNGSKMLKAYNETEMKKKLQYFSRLF